MLEVLYYQYQCLYELDRHDSYNKLMIKSNSCQSFEHIARICQLIWNAKGSIQMLEVVGQKGEIKSGWTAIYDCLVEWVIRINDKNQMCEFCREIISSNSYQLFNEHLNSLKYFINRFGIINTYTMSIFNLGLKQTFGNLYNQIAPVCNNWKNNKKDVIQIRGKYGASLMEVINNVEIVKPKSQDQNKQESDSFWKSLGEIKQENAEDIHQPSSRHAFTRKQESGQSNIQGSKHIKE